MYKSIPYSHDENSKPVNWGHDTYDVFSDEYIKDVKHNEYCYIDIYGDVKWSEDSLETIQEYPDFKSFRLCTFGVYDIFDDNNLDIKIKQPIKQKVKEFVFYNFTVNCDRICLFIKKFLFKHIPFKLWIKIYPPTNNSISF